MATITQTAPEAIQTVTINIDSLNSTTTQYSAVSTTIIDNETGLYLYASFFLELGSTSITTLAGAFCGLYLLPSVDGAGYPLTAGGSISPGEGYLAATFPLQVGGYASQKSSAINVPIPPLKFKLMLANFSGVTLSTSNTLKYRRHNLTVA